MRQGKGVNTKFILSSRGLTRAVTMSSLLERHAGIRQMMDNGDLVPDTMVRVWTLATTSELSSGLSPWPGTKVGFESIFAGGHQVRLQSAHPLFACHSGHCPHHK